jgi:hypothetical protein
MAFWLIYKADAQPCLTQSKNCEAEQRVRSSSSICVARHNIYEAFIVRRGTSVLGQILPLWRNAQLFCQQKNDRGLLQTAVTATSVRTALPRYPDGEYRSLVARFN